MKPKRSKKPQFVDFPRGKWVDVFEGIKPGEVKQIDENTWAASLVMEILDPPEPIKKPGKRKPRKK